MKKRNGWPPLAAGLCLLAVSMLLGACASPYVRPAGAVPAMPRLGDDFAIMDDGFRLPVSQWSPAGYCRATVLALHGLNDYRNAFRSTGEYLATRGIRVIAYDQRGFGETSGFGEWHGSGRLTRDLGLMVELVQRHYPECPLYLLGESMGGAVVLAGAGELRAPIAGLILVAPAVWSRDSMPFYQRALLWLAAHSFPDRRLTGKGLDLQPSDNIEMLRALGRDPYVIKETRVDVLYGVTNLMDQAVHAGNEAHLVRTLFLYGERDDIIPKVPTCRLLQRLPADAEQHLQVALYENGYHMLTRDLQAERVLEDIAAWVTGVADIHRLTRQNVERFCSGSS